MPKALIIEPVHPVLLAQLDELGYEYTLVKTITKAEAIKVMPEYTGLITSNKLYVDKDIIDAGPNLLWIGRMGSGMEIIDVAYAASKNIHCVNSPEGNANSVAEQALGMLLSLMHNVVKSHQQLQNGIWQRDENRGEELFGKTVGIIGYGHNGSLFAEKLLAMGCKVVAYDPYKEIPVRANLTQVATLNELYNQIDILSFHIPLTEETYHFFNDEALAQLSKPIYFLNIARGAVVDLASVVKGMESGMIKACAIDVWEEEPVVNAINRDADSFKYLAAHPYAIVTAHIGGYSHQATYKMSAVVAQKIAAIIPAP